MCGIIAAIRSQQDLSKLREVVLRAAKLVRHRGPDWSGVHEQSYKVGETLTHNMLAHERLTIVGIKSGAQPILSKGHALTVNGEIYNWRELRQSLQAADPEIEFTTDSDCEMILHTYLKSGVECLHQLDGVFAFVIASETGDFFAARDPIGVMPMYYGRAMDGTLWFASEMKALMDVCVTYEEFPPGHYYDAKDGLKRYFEPKWTDLTTIPEGELDLVSLRETFEQAVIKRMMCDAPYGVLLSGGLDSSLVASIVTRNAAKRIETGGTPWWSTVHSFSIGLEGSPDLKAAQDVAAFLKTEHHEFTFTIQEGIDALRDVIWHLETYDVTTIRASTPMYLLSRRIKAMGVKMVLSGEGSDEIMAGYLYFHKAPSPADLHVETVEKVLGLSKYDCLRANKTTAAWGVEARVPFLDQKFMEVAFAMDPKYKMCVDGKMEKYVLRKAFDDPDDPYLPESVLWRVKEAFSDGVGYSWIDSLKAHAEKSVSDELFGAAEHRFPHNTPMSKEAYFYRAIFSQLFPHHCAALQVPGGPSVACSTATAAKWDPQWEGKYDPSGRAVTGIHAAAF